MKKTNQKRARIIYNEQYDSFDVEIMTERGWELDRSYKCQSKSDDRRYLTNYVHIAIIRHIADLNNMGYKVEVLE